MFKNWKLTYYSATADSIHVDVHVAGIGKEVLNGGQIKRNNFSKEMAFKIFIQKYCLILSFLFSAGKIFIDQSLAM